MRLPVKIDVLILTECWWNTNTTIPKLPGYNSYNTTNFINKCGGVTAYVHNEWSAMVTEPEVHDCNCLKISIGKDFLIFGIYRSPSFRNVTNFLSSLNDVIVSSQTKGCIILAGDINLNIIGDPQSEESIEYLSLAAEHQLIPAILEPTRENACLDHIFVKKGFEAVGVVCNSFITDHKICILGIASSSPPTIPLSRSRIIIDYPAVVDDLQKVDWSRVTDLSEVNQAVNEFQAILSSTVSSHSRLLVVSRSRYNIKPWITPGLIKCQRYRDKLHLKVRKNPDNKILQTTYRRYRNFYKELLHRVKTDYEKQKLLDSKDNPKKLWKTINNICDNSKSENSASELLASHEDPVNSLNVCNKYFANVGKSLAENILSKNSTTESTLAFSLNSNNSSLNSFFISPTDSFEISNLISNFKSDCAPGYDGLTGTLIKHIKPYIVKPLTYICNLSIESGTFPTSWKHAVVVPIHKDGPRDVSANYRPISLLSLFSKLLEKVVNIRLVDYLEAKLYLSERQFGFRRGRSAEDAVVLVTNLISSAVDQNLRCVGVFLDLAKAFDSVSIPILSKKLEAVGVRGIALEWFRSYLNDRRQRVRVGSSLSDELPVSFGVPQGSILGPTLFTIYMNDILNLNIPGVDIICYADDTVVIFKDKDWEKVLRAAEVGISHVATWLNNNLLTLNSEKTKFMTFFKTQRSAPPPNLSMAVHCCTTATECVSFSSSYCSCDRIGKVDRVRYLGIEFDESLTFKHHISKLSSRVRKLIYVMKALRHSCDPKTLYMVYTSLCQAILTYCNLAWGGSARTVMLPLERAQRAVLKVMLSKPFRFPTDNLYREALVLTVRQLFIHKATVASHIAIKNASQFGELLKRRVFRVPIASVKSAFANRHPQSLLPRLYNAVLKVLPELKDERSSRVKWAVREWLLTLSYEDTENLITRIRTEQ